MSLDSLLVDVFLDGVVCRLRMTLDDLGLQLNLVHQKESYHSSSPYDAFLM